MGFQDGTFPPLTRPEKRETLEGQRDVLLRRNAKQLQGGLIFKAHRRVYQSTLGLRVVKKKKQAMHVKIFVFGSRVQGIGWRV